MSSINDNITAAESMNRPEHHVHRADEPLPGARGAAPTVDYSPDNMDRLPSKVWADETHMVPTRDLMTGDVADSHHHHKDKEFRSQPMQPAHAVDHEHDDHNPTRKATATDKLIGKAQAVVGKVAHKPELQEKGELRATEGKTAL